MTAGHFSLDNTYTFVHKLLQLLKTLRLMLGLCRFKGGEQRVVQKEQQLAQNAELDYDRYQHLRLHYFACHMGLVCLSCGSGLPPGHVLRQGPLSMTRT